MNKVASSFPYAVIDIGNSNVKIATSESLESNDFDLILRVDPRQENWRDTLLELSNQLPRTAMHWICCSVNTRAHQAFQEFFRELRPDDIWLDLTNDDVAFEIVPQPAKNVGTDRLMAAAGAVALVDLRFRNQPTSSTIDKLIIIDAGTAITVDAVEIASSSQAIRFLGGTIRPGLTLQRDALHRYTSALPDLSFVNSQIPQSVIGQSTEEAILAGTLFGELGALASLVQLIEDELQGKAMVFVTGGDGEWMSRYFEDEWHFEPHLVQLGMLQVARQKLNHSPTGTSPRK
ncbi:MAG TPA: type III pantothenate kinase [Pirellulaceae bacterium]|nr:type III pantothenate kinase [Pirellulaceae bacterium]HMO91563.1 type III pantothenate kinase [Pirellulaceae bacterium]HMP68260.1 type III pantothenate kinase [Pirellulaceae bacterium]